MSQTMPPLDPVFADAVFTELATLEVGLDSDPLVYGPKRLNGKIALSRKMTARCERLFLDVSQKLSQYKRSLRAAELMLDLAKKHLLANDPEVRAGRAVSERDAIASGKLKAEVQAVYQATHAVEDLDAVLTVIKAKRSDLRDVQGRLRDQIRLCGEEIGLGGRWGSKSPRGTELEPGQGFADGTDVEDVDELIQNVRAISDAETHLPAEVDDSDPEVEQEEDLAAPLVEEEEEEEPEEAEPEEAEPEEPEAPAPAAEADPAIIPGDELADEFGFVPHCAECGEKQHRVVGSGMACPNGHGGCDSVDPAATELDVVEDGEPTAEAVLPGTAEPADVAEFLADTTVETEAKLSRRQVEEEDSGLDIESILANFES